MLMYVHKLAPPHFVIFRNVADEFGGRKIFFPLKYQCPGKKIFSIEKPGTPSGPKKTLSNM